MPSDAAPPGEPALDPARLEVPLDGFAMHLRPSELERVAAGLGEFDSSLEGDLLTLAEALRRLPVGDRAPTWELAMRRYGHRKPLAQAAGEIGLDEVHARELLARYTRLLVEVPPPEHALPDAEPLAGTYGRGTAMEQIMSEELLGNARAHGDRVDLDARHEASMEAVEETRERPAAP